MINKLIKLLETKYQHRIPFTIYCELMSDIWQILAEEKQANVKDYFIVGSDEELPFE